MLIVLVPGPVVNTMRLLYVNANPVTLQPISQFSLIISMHNIFPPLAVFDDILRQFHPIAASLHKQKWVWVSFLFLTFDSAAETIQCSA